jgi:hypothetical protein
MKTRQGYVVVSFLLVLFLLFGASAANAGCLVLEDATYSVEGNGGPWFDEDSAPVDVCEGDTLWIRVEVDDPIGCGSVNPANDNWQSTRISYRYGSGADPFTLLVCDSSPNYTSGDHTLVFEVTVPDVPDGSSPQELDFLVEIFNADSCGGGVGLFEDDDDYNVLNVYENPDCSITADCTVCAGETELTASVSDAGAGATYAWVVNNGILTGGQGTNQITWTAGDPGMMTISVDVTNAGGCTCSNYYEIGVNPVPTCGITAPETVFFGSTDNIAFTDATPGGTYEWVIYVDDVLNNSLITVGQGTNQITWTAPDSFDEIKIGVTVTSEFGCECINDPPVAGGDGGVTVTGTRAGAIPTLSEWGMIIFSLLLAGTAMMALRRRNKMTV